MKTIGRLGWVIAALLAATAQAEEIASQQCDTERGAMLRHAGELSEARERLRAAFVAGLPLIDTLAAERAFVDAHNAFTASVKAYRVCAEEETKP